VRVRLDHDDIGVGSRDAVIAMHGAESSRRVPPYVKEGSALGRSELGEDESFEASLTRLHTMLVVYAVARQANEKSVQLKVVEADAALHSKKGEQVSFE
jgi:hypothetical protein